MSDEVILDGQDLIIAAVTIGSEPDDEKRAKMLEGWDAMFANNCDVNYCIGTKSDGHGRDGIHFDGTGTSFRENGQILHTYHDPITD